MSITRTSQLMLCWEIIAVPRLAQTTNTPCGQRADFHTRNAPFWVITQQPLKMEPIGCPETSERNCHYTLRNNPHELSDHLLRVGSPKSFRRWLQLQLSLSVMQFREPPICRQQDLVLPHELLITSAVPLPPPPTVPSVGVII